VQDAYNAFTLPPFEYNESMEKNMNDLKPLVSIVIPTYNQKHPFLIECIESALNQTYSNIEIVISDNHSNNGASDIIANYAANDKRIKVKKPANHLPIIKSFLFAIDNAIGKYSCIISSDDILLPSCIDELVAVIEANSNVVLAHGEAIHFTPDGKETLEWKHFNMQSGIYRFEDGMKKFIEHHYTYMAGALFRNNLYRKIESEPDRTNYSYNITYSYDTYLLFRMLEFGNIGYIGKPLAKVRVENETRSLINSRLLQDFYFTYEWLEKSSLMKRIPDATKTISEIKSNLGFSYLRSLLYKRIQKIVSNEDYLKLLKYSDKLISTKFVFRKVIIKCILLFPNFPIIVFSYKRLRKHA
jgi:glycosyltransferase involved in cell wall biosynthesis